MTRLGLWRPESTEDRLDRLESLAEMHLVGNHIIDFDAKDEARGIVCCRDELERPERGEWEIGVL